MKTAEMELQEMGMLDDLSASYPELKLKTQLQSNIDQIVTQDKTTKQTIARAAWIANHPISVLITGPTGTGKELLAKVLHGNRKGKFVAVNCGGIPDSLLEAEFFGAQKGSYTGCNETRQGYFEEARDGTIFLDEITELPRSLQCKLLRVLQEQTVRRIGGSGDIKINCRVVSATNWNLETLRADEKTFRSDLYYRLAGTILHLTSLKDRGIEEVKFLFKHFTKGTLPVEEDYQVQNNTWPGNIRELKNYAEECLIFAKFIHSEHLLE